DVLDAGVRHSDIPIHARARIVAAAAAHLRIVLVHCRATFALVGPSRRRWLASAVVDPRAADVRAARPGLLRVGLRVDRIGLQVARRIVTGPPNDWRDHDARRRHHVLYRIDCRHVGDFVRRIGRYGGRIDYRHTGGVVRCICPPPPPPPPVPTTPLPPTPA